MYSVHIRISFLDSKREGFLYYILVAPHRTEPQSRNPGKIINHLPAIHTHNNTERDKWGFFHTSPSKYPCHGFSPSLKYHQNTSNGLPVDFEWNTQEKEEALPPLGHDTKWQELSHGTSRPFVSDTTSSLPLTPQQRQSDDDRSTRKNSGRQVSTIASLCWLLQRQEKKKKF